MEASVPEGCAERGSSSAPASGIEPGRSGVCSAPAGGALLLGSRGDAFPHRGRRTGRAALRRSGRTATGRGGFCVCAIGSAGAPPRHGGPADPAGLLSIGRLLVQGRSEGPPAKPRLLVGARGLPTFHCAPSHHADGRVKSHSADGHSLSWRRTGRSPRPRRARPRSSTTRRYPAASSSVSSPRVSPTSAGTLRTAIRVPAT